MLFLVLIFLELLVLFLSSRILTRTLSLFFYRVTESQTTTVYLLSFLFLPGVIIHELAHLLSANLLFVRTGEVEFMPQIRGNSVKLGSVAIGQTDPFRRAIIGFAPVLFGTTLLLLSLFAFFNGMFDVFPKAVGYIVLLYIVFELGNTMFSSSKDVEGTIELLIVLTIVFLALFIIGIRIPDYVINTMFSKDAIAMYRLICLFLLLPLGVNGVSILALRVLTRQK